MPRAGLMRLSRQQRQVVYALERGYTLNMELKTLSYQSRPIQAAHPTVIESLTRKGIIDQHGELIPGYRARVKETT